jgi:hypothetical protein
VVAALRSASETLTPPNKSKESETLYLLRRAVEE